jgi:hypothetical protein
MDDKPRLLDQMHDRARLKHYSVRTERVYCEFHSLSSLQVPLKIGTLPF